MSGLAGLGALADGISQGLVAGEQLGSIREARARQKKADAEAERVKALDMEAQSEAVNVLEQRKQAATQGQGAMNQYLTLGGTDSSMPDQGAIDTAKPMPPWQPSLEDKIAVSGAYTNALFRQGRVEEGLKRMIADDQRIAPLRKQAIQHGLQVFKTSGDPAALFEAYNKLMPDGMDIELENTTKTEDGKPLYVTRLRNTITGKGEPVTMNAEDIEAAAMMGMDPQAAIRHSFALRKTAFEGEQDRKTNESKHKGTLEEIDRRNEGSAYTAEVRAGASTENTRIRVQGTITAAKIRGSGGGGLRGKGGAASDYFAPRVGGDGRMIAVHKKTGVGKVVTDEDGKPYSAIEYERLVNSTAGQVAKSREGERAQPEANRERAREMLPQPPKPGLSGKDYSNLWK